MKHTFLEQSKLALGDIYDAINAKGSLNLNEIKPEETALVIMDMINGFAQEGALYSDRIKALIPNIVHLATKCDELGIEKLAFADNHPEESPEFTAYPPHCLRGTNEAELVAEIKAVGNYQLIKKNSTNGFLEPDFQTWLNAHPAIKRFIIVGDCTDICVMQFAVTLKAYFNRLNQTSDIIVPLYAVDTYDGDLHDGDLLHLMALHQMDLNDVTIVKQIKY